MTRRDTTHLRRHCNNITATSLLLLLSRGIDVFKEKRTTLKVTKGGLYANTMPLRTFDVYEAIECITSFIFPIGRPNHREQYLYILDGVLQDGLAYDKVPETSDVYIPKKKYGASKSRPVQTEKLRIIRELRRNAFITKWKEEMWK